MSKARITARAVEREAYQAGMIRRFEAGQERLSAQVCIELQAQEGRRLICSGCGQESHQVHDRQVRRARNRNRCAQVPW